MNTSAWAQAWRSLWRRPIYLTVAVLTLGAGSGLTTAVWSLAHTVLIRPLPYPDAGQLVTVYESSPAAREGTSLVAPGRLEDWNRLTRTFVALSGSYAENVTDTSADRPERLEGRRVAPRFFTAFGTAPALGRTFTDAEEQPNGPGAVVVSDRFWARRFNRDRSAIGHALVIGGRPYVIVGVMPVTFTPVPTDVWLPAQTATELMRIRNARYIRGIGRVRPGVTLAEAARDLAAAQQALAKEFPATDAGWSAEIRPLKEARIGDARRGLVLVAGAVSLLWAIAVANVAGLTLVQYRRRARTLAIRAALGASRLRLAGTVVREGLLIAAAGAAAGGALAAWLIGAMPALLPATPRINELTFDARALGLAALTSLVAACAAGLAPAFAATRAAVSDLLAGGARATAGTRHRAQQALVIAQVGLTVLLVGSASILLRSYYDLTRTDVGFDASNVVAFHVGARWDEDRVRIGRLQTELLSRLRELPHVQSAGMTNFLPASGATLRYRVTVDGLSGPNADGSMNVGGRMISSGYLRAIRAPLVAGSWCESPPPGDFDAPRAAMVNRRFLEAYGVNASVVGRSLRIVQGVVVPYTIAGVVGDLAEDGHAAPAFPYVYTCDAAGAWPDPEYVVRTADARSLAADLRTIVLQLDPARAVFGLRPLQDVLDGALDRPRLDAAMLGLFAGAALLLAAIGLNSLFMLVVAERGREMAVRLAVGATPGGLVRLVMRDAGRLLAGGLVLGVVLTAAADRALRGLWFGAGPLDASSVGIAVLTLACVSALAVAAPALRAARVAPMDVLRAE